MKINRLFCVALVVGALLCVSSCVDKGADKYSVRMVRSEMSRNETAAHIDGLEGRLKWNYTTGLELKAMLDVYERYGGEDIFQYAEGWYDSIIAEDGTIATYKLSKHNLDHICPGRTLFYLYEKTGKEKYLKAIHLLREQIASQPRTTEGGFWHKEIYPWQMWLDGLYMAEPFYAQYTATFSSAEDTATWNDIAHQFILVAIHTYDPQTGLLRHAWDESREMFWADKATGQSDHAWGRALGWYMMALVDVLDWIPAEQDECRAYLVDIYKNLCDVLPKYADEQSGMWYQVLDCPGREGNYLEATASAMFTYAYMKGLRKGYLPQEMTSYVKGLYPRLVETFLRENEDGTLSLEQCCAVAGLGGKENRRGDYLYYINEKICENDPKGIGPFIWASLENEYK